MTKLTTIILFASCLLLRSGEIADFYFAQASENTNRAQIFAAAPLKSRTNEEVESTNHGITEIGVERSACFGSCPSYTFIARSDGTFQYKGDKFVEHRGEFSGKISIGQFHALAQFIRDSGYMGFENQYRREVTDSPTTLTMVVMNGKRKVISNYANAGPATLWAIEKLIDDLMIKAEWKPDLPKAPAPILPKVTRYDNEPVLRAAYLDAYQKGYVDAWDRMESLPVSGPTTDVEKAKVFGYGDGMIAGRAALAVWFGTNRPAAGPGTSRSLNL